MIKVDYLLVCEDVQIDNLGRSTIVNIVDRLNAPRVPASLRGVKVTFRLHPENKAIVNQTISFKIMAELSGKEAWRGEANIPITVEKNNGHAQVIPIDPMVFPEFGTYWIKLFIDGKEMAKTIFVVKDSAELTEP